MLMPLLLLLGGVGVTRAADKWEISVGVLVGAHAVDAASSWGRQELNPVLGAGGRRFGQRQVTMKAVMIAANWAVQRWVVKRHPRMCKPLMVVNFAGAGVAGGVAVSNWRRR